MKKLLILSLIVSLVSCQKYEEISNPQLNINGRWYIADYTLSFNSTTVQISKIVSDNFVALSPFQVVSKGSDGWLIRNDTSGVKPCFIYKRGYQWEFDYNNLVLKDNLGNILDKYRIYFDDPYYGSGFKLMSLSTGEYIAGHWDYTRNGNGAMPSTQFTITVPVIECDINDASRKYSRAVQQHINLTMTR